MLTREEIIQNAKTLRAGGEPDDKVRLYIEAAAKQIDTGDSQGQGVPYGDIAKKVVGALPIPGALALAYPKETQEYATEFGKGAVQGATFGTVNVPSQRPEGIYPQGRYAGFARGAGKFAGEGAVLGALETGVGAPLAAGAGRLGAEAFVRGAVRGGSTLASYEGAREVANREPISPGNIAMAGTMGAGIGAGGVALGSARRYIGNQYPEDVGNTLLNPSSAIREDRASSGQAPLGRALIDRPALLRDRQNLAEPNGAPPEYRRSLMTELPKDQHPTLFSRQRQIYQNADDATASVQDKILTELDSLEKQSTKNRDTTGKASQIPLSKFQPQEVKPTQIGSREDFTGGQVVNPGKFEVPYYGSELQSSYADRARQEANIVGLKTEGNAPGVFDPQSESQLATETAMKKSEMRKNVQTLRDMQKETGIEIKDPLSISRDQVVGGLDKLIGRAKKLPTGTEDVNTLQKVQDAVKGDFPKQLTPTEQYNLKVLFDKEINDKYLVPDTKISEGLKALKSMSNLFRQNLREISPRLGSLLDEQSNLIQIRGAALKGADQPPTRYGLFDSRRFTDPVMNSRTGARLADKYLGSAQPKLADAVRGRVNIGTSRLFKRPNENK